MARGEVSEIADHSLADDLLRAGYIIPLEVEKKPKEEKVKSEEIIVVLSKSRKEDVTS